VAVLTAKHPYALDWCMIQAVALAI